MANCIFCGSKLQSSVEEGFWCTTYSSFFSKELSGPCSYHTSSISGCRGCNVAYLASDSKYSVLGNLNKFIEYKEPYFHHSEVASLIMSSASSALANEVICLSLKDCSLSKTLIQKGCDEAHDYSRLIASAKDIKFGCKALLTNKCRIWLATRIIEHINRQDLLNELIDFIAIGDILYLEILDFSELEDRGDYSFIWDERISYPSLDFLKAYFEGKGFSLANLYRGVCDEPFWSLILIREDIIKTPSFKVQPTSKPRMIDLQKIFCTLERRAHRITAIADSFVVYGVGHKSLTMSNFLIRSRPNISIKLQDSNKNKIGAYWNRLKIEVLASPPPHADIHFLSFNNKTSFMIKDEVTLSQPLSQLILVSDFFKQ